MLNYRIYRDGTIIEYFTKHKSKDRDIVTWKPPKNEKPKEYKINKKLIRSASLACFINKRTKHLLHIVLTLPENIDLKYSNKAFSNFIDNIKKNRGVKNYVFVVERQKNRRIHYHILIEINYISYKYLQKAWEIAIFNVTGIKHITHNSVRAHNPIVNNIKQMMYYLTKYISKNTDTFNSRCYGFSNDLVLYKDIDELEISHFQEIFNIEIQFKLVFESDFFAVFKILDKFLINLNKDFF